jgi:dihydrofolate synthase/folylpolyglutamate synthase
LIQINTIQEAQAVLWKYMPKRREMTKSGEMMLDRIKPLLKLLGNPHEDLKVIHIAGTSGKTSTAYYASALLASTGKKVGLTVSPYVDRINERIQINGQPISDELFCSELTKLIQMVDDAGQYPSYFEIVYAFSIWVMASQKVDYAVVETGVGGLYDATNVNVQPNKVCIITDIGFDHMHLLGHTLGEIAAQKIGIVHQGNHVFMYEQSREIMTVARQWVDSHQAFLHTVEAGGQAPVWMAEYQHRNWHLALKTIEYVIQRDNLDKLTQEPINQSQHIIVPGRMDVRAFRGKQLVMDGAHNAQKMQAFIDSFKRLYPDSKPAALVSVKNGKEYEDIVALLSPIVSRVITTSFDTAQDLPLVSMDPEELASAFRQAGVEAQSLPDEHEALEALVDGSEEVCIITGSFYLLGQIRNNEHLV